MIDNLRFNTLKDIVKFTSNCRCCSKQLEPDVVYDNFDEGNFKYFSIDSGLSNAIGFDFDNNEIDFKYLIDTRKHHNNLIEVPMQYICSNCSSYMCVIEVKLSLEKSQIEDIVLNAELVIVDHGGITYEIENIYEYNLTEISIFGTTRSSEQLPLVEINFSNPVETVHRINKLLTFI